MGRNLFTFDTCRTTIAEKTYLKSSAFGHSKVRGNLGKAACSEQELNRKAGVLVERSWQWGMMYTGSFEVRHERRGKNLLLAGLDVHQINTHYSFHAWFWTLLQSNRGKVPLAVRPYIFL